MNVSCIPAVGEKNVFGQWLVPRPGIYNSLKCYISHIGCSRQLLSVMGSVCSMLARSENWLISVLL